MAPAIPCLRPPPGEVLGDSIQDGYWLRRVARDGSGIVRLQWEGTKLRVSARAEEKGETAVPVPASSTGPGRVGLNNRYLLDYFGGRSGLVTISPSSETGPALFSHRGRTHVIIMPMFLKEW